MLEIWIKLIVSIVTFSSLVLLTFAIFKIPLIEHHRIITIMSLVLGTVSFYARFIVETPLFGLIAFSIYVVLLMVLKQYPILYSFIVCGIGFLVVLVIDTAVTITSIQINFTGNDLMKTPIKHFVVLNLLATCVALLITFALKYFNVGFSFVIKKFSARQVLKSYNFLWAGIIVITVTIAQIGFLNINLLSLHFYIFLAIAVGLLFTLVVAYKQNRKSLRDRFGR
jgi:hypothetical protein